MSKQEQLMEYVTQDIVCFLVEDQQMEYTEAMHLLYTSETYGKLLDEETGLYLESAAYLYDIFKDECDKGRIIQIEF